MDTGVYPGVAIVGVACRLPGRVNGPADLWQALDQGRDLVGEVPPDRFETHRFVDAEVPRTGRSYTSAGGYLAGVADFDAGYFGISPKEAIRLDPQHRLLLELAVEALDDAAIAPERLAGSDTAVYVGISDTSYGALQMSASTIDAYTMSGAASALAANRISYCLDLRGPSLIVDTACSSSLIALDHACRALVDGTSGTALCGGVNMLLSPYHYVGFSQAGMLSRRGKCAAFSANADGFVRAEGGVVLVLKRLPDALADGDRVHGVILGTGTNSDGKTMGVSLPSASAQERLLRSVYDRAGVHPDQLAYFEAHGTGTAVGDPAEATAIGQALGRRRTVGPLPIGTIKSNVGHLEPASGLAGVVKALLVLRHRRIPVSLHAEPLNPDIDFSGLGLAPGTVAGDLPTGPAVIGVNSFGFGGANAHAVLASPPESAAPAPSQARRGTGVLPLLVSADTPAALADAVTRHAERLADADEEEFYDLAYTSCLRRGRRRHRAAVLASGPAEGGRLLAAIDGQETATGAVRHGRVALVFSGNGAQWAGMAADLLSDEPVFRAAMAELDAALAPHLGWSVTARLVSVTADELAATETAQPLLFAVQVGLVQLLREHGVRPATVLGHSVGEVAAAWAAGALSLDQAALVVAARSRTQAPTAGLGRMAAVGLSRKDAQAVLANYPELELAAVNTGRDVTIAGPTEQVEKLADELHRREILCTLLDLAYPFHSAAMDQVREPLEVSLAGLAPTQTHIPLVSTVTGRPVPGDKLDAGYWWRNVREPVLFADAVEHVLADGVDVLLELGPHPVLRGYLRRLAAGSDTDPVAVVPTLHRDTGGRTAVRSAVAALIAAGAEPDWTRYFPVPGRVVDLPAYPWQRERYWSGRPQDWVRTSGDGVIQHPLLGERMPAPYPSWHGEVDPTLTPWLADHRLAGTVVMPAAGFVEMALTAGRLGLDCPVEAHTLEIARPLVVPWPDPSGLHVQVSVRPEDGTVAITSTLGDDPEPRRHVRGRVRQLVGQPPPPVKLAGIRAELDRDLDADEQYARMDAAGLNYGPTFRVLRESGQGPGVVLAAYHHDTADDGYTLHPALLDGALHAGVPLGIEQAGEHMYLPAALDRVRVWHRPRTTGFILVRDRSRTAAELCWDITVMDPDGTVAVELAGCRMRRMAAPLRTPITRHRTALRAAPREVEPVDASPLPAPSRLIPGIRDRITDLRHRYSPAIRRTAANAQAFHQRLLTAALTLLPAPDQSFTIPELVDGGMLAQHARLLELVLPALVASGRISSQGPGRWRLNRTGAGVMRGDALWDAPEAATETMAALGIDRHLPQLLRGENDPLEILATPEVERAVELFFDQASPVRWQNLTAQAVLRQIVRGWPTDRPLRVLEVGAGTGGLAATLLPVLPADRTRYVFTDVSPYFVSRAPQRLSGHDFVEYRTLDLDLEPEEQGFTGGSFDLVLAANALHTARDLRAALHRIAALLGPGGRLLATESHDPLLLAPVFGLLDSFWHSSDHDLRPGNILLPAEDWPGVLNGSGFTGVTVIGDTDDPDRSAFSVVVASAPHRPIAPGPLPGPPEDVRWVIAAETPDELPFAEAVAALVRSARPELDRTTDDPVCAVVTGGWPPLEPDSRCMTAVVLILGDQPATTPEQLVDLGVRRAALLRGLAQQPADARLALWLVARPSDVLPTPPAAGDTGTGSAADALAWGAARTLSNERPDLDVRRIELRRGPDLNGDANRLVRELFDPTDEDEIVLTGNGRFVVREVPRTGTVPAAEAYELRVSSPGLSYRLGWRARPTPEPGPGQVVVAVRAAALNYRDIMQATGLLPPELFETTGDVGPGLECAGVVSAVGPGVTQLAVGDRVYGMAPGALASDVLTMAGALGRIPDGMSFTGAATIPTVYSTVHYALNDLARLSARDTVLVHGGAGGVGLATLRYAQLRGARIIATAGTGTKRELLRELGVEHVFDSRSLEFAEQIRRATDGRGVDVVVNSLAGPAQARSLELLRPGGRFIELGKRDMYEDHALPLRPFRNNLAFYGVDLTALIHDPDRAAALFSEVCAAVEDGSYRPLPHVAFPAGRVEEAFRLLQHSRHIGKVVVCFDPDTEPVTVEGPAAPLQLDPDGVYLITGGLGGFGAATAGWLADRGARHLALVSRRGAQAPEAAGLLETLAAKGVRAVPYAADAADLAAMRRIFAEIDAGPHPLCGVVHSAMHLDDAPLTELTDDRLAAVLRPKVAGACVLDLLTRDRDLDLFLMYSSGSAHTGTVLQAPYAAGNLYLEALARQRRARGLPGHAIAWGAIDGVGYVARNNLAPGFSALGLDAFSPREALAVAADVLGRDHPVTGAGRYNWTRYSSALPSLGGPRYVALRPAAQNQDTAASLEKELARLATLPPEQAMALITETITSLLAEVMQLDPARIDIHRRLDTYGLDSLMGAELLVGARQRFAVEIPPMELLNSGGTIADIAETVHLRLGLRRQDKETPA